MRFQTEQAIEILSRTPAVLEALLGDLDDDWINSENNQTSWNPFDVVGHLIHGEETDWIPRARIILAQGANITFEPFDRFAQFEKSKGKSLRELLAEFAVRREENLNFLRGLDLTEEKLALRGEHPELGKVTLGQLLATWVVHDLNHIRQITEALARKYRDNVGVWKEYLSILD